MPEEDEKVDSSNKNWLGSYIDKGVGDDEVVDKEEKDTEARYVQNLVEFYTDKAVGENKQI